MNVVSALGPVRELMGLGFRFPFYAENGAIYDADGDSFQVVVHRDGRASAQRSAEASVSILNAAYAALRPSTAYQSGFCSAEA